MSGWLKCEPKKLQPRIASLHWDQSVLGSSHIYTYTYAYADLPNTRTHGAQNLYWLVFPLADRPIWSLRVDRVNCYSLVATTQQVHWNQEVGITRRTTWRFTVDLFRCLSRCQSSALGHPTPQPACAADHLMPITCLILCQMTAARQWDAVAL